MILSKQQFKEITQKHLLEDGEGELSNFLLSVGEGSGWDGMEDVTSWFRYGSTYQKSLHYFHNWKEMQQHLRDQEDEGMKMPEKFSFDDLEAKNLHFVTESAVYMQQIDGKNAYLEVAFEDFI